MAEIKRTASRKEKEAVGAAAPAASAVSAKKSGAGKVTVYYNHPRSIVFNVPDSHGVIQSLRINGNGEHLRGLPKGILPTGGTFGRTANVDAELWEAVKARYSQMPAFRNGLIFAVGAGDEPAGELKSRSRLRSGFEPIDPAQSRTEPGSARE